MLREIIMPTVQGMAADGIPFTGFLYAGLMIDERGRAKTIEFNCRLGDPETQPIMARIKSDLTEVFEHAIAGHLDRAEIEWDRRTALGVVLAAQGYPDEPRRGDVIEGVGQRAAISDDCFVFHAGTALTGNTLTTHGGRVLCVTGLGDSVRVAQARAHAVIDGIRFDGMQHRRDIGHRALSRRPGSAKRG